MRVDFSSLHNDLDDTYGYCTEVLFHGKELNVDAIRERLGGLGTCVLAVGDAELMKIHVHTPRPGAVLDVATELGEIVRVKVDNMETQRRDFAASVGRQPEPPSPTVRTAGTSVVAVALGAGFQDIFESYGATVVRVDRTMNPSVEQILDAIDRSNRSDVVLLPNDRNVLLAAQEAAMRLTDRTVEIVATTNMPCGIAAVLAVNPEASAGENTGPMLAAVSACHGIELTRAVRKARIADLELEEGSLFATLDGTPVAASNSYSGLLGDVLGQLVGGPFEIATVYIGGQGSQTEAAELADAIRSRLGIAVEIADGGQPHYDYVISVE
jgi:dihydroxyacetone kinase-like predicted kinase